MRHNQGGRRAPPLPISIWWVMFQCRRNALGFLSPHRSWLSSSRCNITLARFECNQSDRQDSHENANNFFLSRWKPLGNLFSPARLRHVLDPRCGERFFWHFAWPMKMCCLFSERIDSQMANRRSIWSFDLEKERFGFSNLEGVWCAMCMALLRSTSSSSESRIRLHI